MPIVLLPRKFLPDMPELLRNLMVVNMESSSGQHYLNTQLHLSSGTLNLFSWYAGAQLPKSMIEGLNAWSIMML